MSATKEYLGDGAYAELDQWGSIVLTTDNGLAVTNRIVLEPEVWHALLFFVERKRAERERPRKEP